MYSISQEHGDVLAHDTKSTLSQIEEALLRSASQLTSTVEVMRGVNLPIGVKRKLYGSLNATSAKIIEAQQEQDQAIRLLHLINRHNATPIEMFGCPLGWPLPNGLETPPPSSSIVEEVETAKA